MHPRLLSELSEPHRLSGVPYRDGEDHEARSLLTSNGYGVDSDQLIELLENETGILQAAAARVLGAAHTRNAIAPLSVWPMIPVPRKPLACKRPTPSPDWEA